MFAQTAHTSWCVPCMHYMGNRYHCKLVACEAEVFIISLCGFQWVGLLSLFMAVTNNDNQLPAQAAPKLRGGTAGARVQPCHFLRVNNFSSLSFYLPI